MHPGVPHGILLEIYQAALTAVDGARCVAAHLTVRPLAGRIWAVALGKAASAMLAGAFDSLGERLECALLITKHGHLQGREFPRSEVLQAAHPVPDDSSLAAGRQLLDFMTAAPADIEWLFLISGGTSSLVEVLPDGVSLTDVQCANQWLLASGLPIEQMNAIRRRLSRIKGGRLCEYLGNRPARVLLISDVPGDDPAVIASGLLHIADTDEPLPAQLPAWLLALVNRRDAVLADQPTAQIDTEIVARLDQALDAAASAATAYGYRVYRSHERLRGDAQHAGQQIAAALCAGAPGVYLWGGETTVCLPDHPGQGGRCQQLALAAAQVLAGQRGIYLLAAGTDGSDGPGDVAGACVDGQTLERGSLEGLDADIALQRADAGRFLEAAGDLLDTGPTGTNVTDVVIGLKLADV
jgi:hydroxypyruvate reductase